MGYKLYISFKGEIKREIIKSKSGNKKKEKSTDKKKEKSKLKLKRNRK